MMEIAVGSAVFTTIVMTLVVTILVARSWLMPSGSATVTVNERRDIAAAIGGSLLDALRDAGILLPSACGGRGTCGQCRVSVGAGIGPAIAVEASSLSKRELAAGARLACQTTVRGPLSVTVPSEILGVRSLRCKVRSNRNVATLMKELVLELPAGETLEFAAGSYLQVTCPPHRTAFSDFKIDPPYSEEWHRLNLWRYEVASTAETTRAYSLANAPSESDIAMFVIRIATPPPAAAADVPPGIVSSYLFARVPGDEIEIAGPYGSFAVNQSEREMIFVGGGAGMAPLRSMIVDQLERVGTGRKIRFWYGARNLREVFYREEFDRLAREHANFDWTIALSEAGDEEAWDGYRGFIHEALAEQHLARHAAPADCEYYLCGPPMMTTAVLGLLERAGVNRERIRFDDFGA